MAGMNENWLLKAVRQKPGGFVLWCLKTARQKPVEFVLPCLIALLAVVFLSVMFSDGAATFWGGKFGTANDDDINKTETLKFIGLGIGGVLAVIGALAVNRRADAQIKSAKAQVRNNELVEKGHIDERFKVAIQNLASEQPSARIASFYQFYYLAKNSEDIDFVRNISDILCAHLRYITNEDFYYEKTKNEPTEECQSLLDILFKPETLEINKNIFTEIKNRQINLQRTYLVNASLLRVNIEGAFCGFSNWKGVNFNSANLQKVKFPKTNLSHAEFYDTQLKYADFDCANLENAIFSHVDLKGTVFSQANLRNTQFFNSINANMGNFVNIEIDNETTILPPNITFTDNYENEYKTDEHGTPHKIEK